MLIFLALGPEGLGEESQSQPRFPRGTWACSARRADAHTWVSGRSAHLPAHPQGGGAGVSQALLGQGVTLPGPSRAWCVPDRLTHSYGMDPGAQKPGCCFSPGCGSLVLPSCCGTGERSHPARRQARRLLWGGHQEMWDLFFIKVWKVLLTVLVTGPSQV